MGGDSCSKGREFKSWYCILDGHFFTHLFVVKFLICVWKDKIKWKRSRGWPIFLKKHSFTNNVFMVANLKIKIVQVVLDVPFDRSIDVYFIDFSCWGNNSPNWVHHFIPTYLLIRGSYDIAASLFKSGAPVQKYNFMSSQLVIAMIYLNIIPWPNVALYGSPGQVVREETYNLEPMSSNPSIQYLHLFVVNFVLSKDT